jgi:AcrR family transcriptional regulator
VSTTGLRERKKQKTKAAIQREAMRLFKKQGYDETTVEQIAAAAEISPSTFFNYFPTKEDVVIFDEYDPMMIEMLTAVREGETLSQAIRRVLERFAEVMEGDRQLILERSRLSLEVPELRARIWEELEKARDLFAKIIGARSGRGAADFEVQVVAMTLIGIAFQASIEWVGTGGRGNMLDLFARAMDVVGLDSLLDRLEKTTPAG